MKIVAVYLLLISTACAQNLTGEGIQKDFNDVFDYYRSVALKFVDGLGIELEKRVDQYVKAHEEYINQLRNVSKIANITLSPNNQEIINRAISYLDVLIDNYKESLNKNIFTNEFNKYMDMLTSKYLSKAQQLIDQLKNEVTKLPVLGQCWTDSRDELGNIVKTGFIAAKDAALSTVGNAEFTLNLNEYLVKATIDSNSFFISSCQFPGADLNSCISSFLTMVDITVRANI